MDTHSSETQERFHRWLEQYDPNDRDPVHLVTRFIEGINQHVVPLLRSSIWLPTQHPELWGTQIIWSKASGSQLFKRDQNIKSTETYLNTPGEAVHESRKPLRWDLGLPAEQLPFPMLQDIKREGGTDYLIVPFHTDHESEQPWITFSTSKPQGFSLTEINKLIELCHPLSWKVRVMMAEITTKSLLSVYLGANAANRVMQGQFIRGTGEPIHAVIWFCDLRDFTAIGDNRSPEKLVKELDHYFECMASPIEQQGGEILKFIGDAILAVFPYDQNLTESGAKACSNAIAAAQSALENLEKHNQLSKSETTLKAGIALHVGEVLYGNIGGSSRLDFTVIGAAVNETSRVEALCKGLAPILVTKSFAQLLPPGMLVSVGTHSLRGIQDSHELFTLKPDNR